MSRGSKGEAESDKGAEGYLSLASLCDSPMDIDAFLQLASAIAEVVAVGHARQRVYRDLRPSNILVHGKTGKVRLRQHGVTASGVDVFQVEEAGEGNSRELLAFMSPEQLGRMNRIVDSRSDLYSLGALFYFMLTGRPPFMAEDPLELVHCHIARAPKTVLQHRPSVPAIVSEIVMRLLAKTMEKRYQTAAGLKADLLHCLEAVRANRTPEPFPLGRMDVSSQLLIPDKLYGREPDIELLFESFSRVERRGLTEMVLVSGYAGVGKTALVKQLYQPVIRRRAFFVLGKFDQFKRDIPYATFIEAFNGLIRQLLGEKKEKLHYLKQQLLDALDGLGGVIVDIIPQAELIIGEQPPVPPLPVTAAEKRLHGVLRKFIGVFCQEEHPLVMFLDDLQWADTASLQLVEQLVSDQDIGHLLLIGAYRSNEVGPGHPLTPMLGKIRGGTAIVQDIGLAPLSFIDAGNLIGDTLRSDRYSVAPLTELIYERTRGNPFFVIQFLMMLHGEGLVTFDAKAGRWRYQLEKIKQKGFTDNVIDLMTVKLKRLSTNTLEVLRVGACIGNRFDTDGLAALDIATRPQIEISLEEALKEALLVEEGRGYIFVHDRVRQAAYNLTPIRERMELHLRIGKMMLERTDEQDLEENIFEIINHFWLCTSLLQEESERYRVAELGRMAGRKARAASAYPSALSYFKMAVELLDERSWQERYLLTFGLYRDLADALYLNSLHDESRELVAMLLERAESDRQRAELYNMLIIQHTLAARYEEAIECGRSALGLLQIHLPEQGLEEELHAGIARFRELLGERPISHLIDDAEMEEAKLRICMELLANMSVPARYSDSRLFAVIAVISVNLSLENGPTAKSTVGYTAFAMVLQNAMGQYRDAFDFGELALKISERFKDPAQKCQSCMVLGHYLNHWVRHLKWADDIMDSGFREGIAAGEMQWTGYNLAYKPFQPFYRGVELSEVDKEIRFGREFTQKTKNQWATDTLDGLQLALSHLAGDWPEGPDAEEKNVAVWEGRYLEQCQSSRSYGALGRYRVLQAQIHFLFRRFDQALEAVEMAEELVGFFSSSISTVALNLYSSLILAELFARAFPDDKETYERRLHRNQEVMRVWVDNAEENYFHQYLLVEAERARIGERLLEAGELYEQALQAAHEHGFVQDEALIAELAGRFYLRRRQPTIGRSYLHLARKCYNRWGASAKVRELENRYPWLRQPAEETAETAGFSFADLDAMAVVKASQAISGEIVLEKLLETLMRIVMESGGAQSGSLVLEEEGEPILAARAEVRGQPLIIERPSGTPTPEELPLSMLYFVLRTGETVLLEDGRQEHMFAGDGYIEIEQPLSMLCLPLVRQSKTMGALYLENRLMQGAFTRDRLTMLEMLASQASISLENAMLYEQKSRTEEALRQSEEKYRAIFEDSGMPLIFIEEDKTVSICNKAFEKLTGYSRTEMEGRKKWTELVARKEELETMSRYHELRRQEPSAAPQTYEFVLVDRFGAFKDVVATVSMMPGTKRSLASLMDITERKRALEALHQSERKFKAIFDSSFQFMGLLSVDGKVLDANETSLEFAGVTRREVVGSYLWQSPWFAHSSSLQERLREAVASAARGEVLRFEATHMDREGKIRYIDFSLKPVLDDSGEVSLLIPEGRDITSRKLAEQEQARLVTAIEQSAEGIFITDTEFRISYVNPALEHISGFAKAHIIGHHMSLFFADQEGENSYDRMTGVLVDGEVFSGRLLNQRADGSTYNAEVTASPVRDRSGEVINYVCVHRDITREIELEKDVRQAHKMEAIGTLAGGIAHDFNNILAVIQGHTELATLQLAQDSPLKVSLERVMIACARARDLVSQILAFSRKSEHEKKTVQLSTLLKEVMQLLRSSLPTTIEIKVEVAEEVKYSTILADATQIHQVIMNLATNAAYAMRKHGGMLDVHLRRSVWSREEHGAGLVLASGEYLVIEMRDTGEGMDGAVLERIFDPYFTTKGPGEGSGMGLAVTQGIVKGHGGTIKVWSRLGLGTTFQVYFPEKRGEIETEPAKETVPFSGSGHILFVDDEEVLVEVGGQMLEELGYRVTTCQESSEAWRIFQAAPDGFDLVITDMTMPKLTGIELAERILSLRPQLPVILCSGFSDQLYGERIQQAGIREVVMKPWEMHQLAAILRRILHPDAEQGGASS